MRTQLLAFSLSITLTATAQMWCPPGATWWYDYHTIAGGIGYLRANYVADTVVAGVVAHKLTAHVEGVDQWDQQPISYDLPPLYTALIGDVVGLWTGLLFDTLFNYGAAPGDQWVPAGTSEYSLYTVLDTGTALIDGQPLRWWAVDIGDNINDPADTIFERLGGLHVFLRPELIHAVTDPEVWDLRCYQDDQINYHTGIAPVCDLILALDTPVIPPHFVLFPNPGTDHVELDLGTYTTGEVLFYDALGRLRLRERITTNRQRIGTAALSSGAYSIEFRTAARVVQRAKWIKQ